MEPSAINYKSIAFSTTMGTVRGVSSTAGNHIPKSISCLV